jgi:hypothetical protein
MFGGNVQSACIALSTHISLEEAWLSCVTSFLNWPSYACIIPDLDVPSSVGRFGADSELIKSQCLQRTSFNDYYLRDVSTNAYFRAYTAAFVSPHYSNEIA